MVWYFHESKDPPPMNYVKLKRCFTHLLKFKTKNTVTKHGLFYERTSSEVKASNGTCIKLFFKKQFSIVKQKRL